jgi:hypothetical protein
MRRLALLALPWLAATGASAHPSVMPHAHPHGAVPVLDGILLAVLLAGVAGIAIGKLRRRQRQ